MITVAFSQLKIGECFIVVGFQNLDTYTVFCRQPDRVSTSGNGVVFNACDNAQGMQFHFHDDTKVIRVSFGDYGKRVKS